MPIITLTTDLGYTDFYVAKLKSAILKRVREVTFLDVSHAIASHDIQQAAFSLMNIWNELPEGSIHLISVYNHYSSRNQYVVFEHQGHYFVGPNNGVFSLLHENIAAKPATIIDMPSGAKSLFDLFAHGIACISTGIPINEIGEAETTLNEKLSILPVHTSDEIRATIIHVDHFGNVVLNVKKEFFEKIRQNRAFEIYFKHSEPIQKISHGYSQVPVGEVVALFNVLGNMELAINMGNASSMLDLYKNETIQIHFKN